MVQSLLMRVYDVAAIDRSKRRLIETEANRADIEAGC
jgi:hypothetical protein